MEELCATGLLDDARFARRFAGDKRDLDQWGSRRIAGELGRRGVGAELAPQRSASRSTRKSPQPERSARGAPVLAGSKPGPSSVTSVQTDGRPDEHAQHDGVRRGRA